MEGQNGGDGKTSPFGNGAGAPASGPASGGHDFSKNPSLPASGTNHDFTRGGSLPPKGNMKDMTKGDAPSQPSGDDPSLNQSTVSPGGKLPHRDPLPGSPDVGALPGEGGRKPFRLKGQ